MNVNVFVSRADGALQSEILVLPQAPNAPLPEKYRNDWHYFATVDTGDKLFGDIDARAIESELASAGYAVVRPALAPE